MSNLTNVSVRYRTIKIDTLVKKNIESLMIKDSKVEKIEFPDDIKVKEMLIINCPKIVSLKIPASVETLYLENLKLYTLDISNCTKLKNIKLNKIAFNKLQVDVSNCKELGYAIINDRNIRITGYKDINFAYMALDTENLDNKNEIDVPASELFVSTKGFNGSSMIFPSKKIKKLCIDCLKPITEIKTKSELDSFTVHNYCEVFTLEKFPCMSKTFKEFKLFDVDIGFKKLLGIIQKAVDSRITNGVIIYKGNNLHKRERLHLTINEKLLNGRNWYMDIQYPYEG